MAIKRPQAQRAKGSKNKRSKSTGAQSKTGTKAQRRKGTKKKSNAHSESKYSEPLRERVRMAIVELGTLNQRGQPAWEKIAALVGVSRQSLLNWRTESSGYYQPDFAEMVAEAVACVDDGQIKRGLLNIAKPHRVVKRVRALRKTGIQPPPKSWTKGDHLLFARIKLGLELDPELSKIEIRLLIEKACEATGAERLVVVREESTREVDTTAAKIALPHIGEPLKRWMLKEGRVHDIDGGLKELLDEINDEPEPLLPEPRTHDRGRTEGKNEESHVAAQSSVLDHG